MRVDAVPDEVEFVDEQGALLGWPVLHLGPGDKLMIADLSTRWHQSFQTTVLRMLRRGLRTRRTQ